MAEELELEIVTPFGITLAEPVKSCVLPGENGQFQVLNLHAPLVSLIKIGAIKVTDRSGGEKYLATSSGYCEIKENKIKVIVESAEPAGQIDLERARSAKERAEKRLSGKKPDIDLQRAELALKRALNRLKIAEFGI